MHIFTLITWSYVFHLVVCSYSEKLTIQPINRGNALAQFEFQMSQVLDKGISKYTSFPRSLGQIVLKSNIKELHLRFGQGLWDSQSWGSAPANGTLTGGIGIELWAWVGGNSKEEAWKNWRRLVHSLGGYFCASINFIDEKITTFPSELVHQPKGKDTKGSWLMRGALPAEPICTENLTPFLKLLPCKGNAGIASLLDGHSLFKSRWQSMAVDIWKPNSETISLLQTVSNVIDTDRCDGDVQPRPVPQDELRCDRSKPWSNDWTCYPVTPQDASYTLSRLFGKTISGHCAVSTHSIVEVLAPDNWLVNKDSQLRRIEIKDNTEHDLHIESESADLTSELRRPELYIERSFSVWGQQSGGIRTVFTNPGNSSLSVAYLETLPWFMKIFLHTTQLRGEGDLKDQHYIPSKDRMRPTQLESMIELPPLSKFEIEYSFDKSLLFIEEYPPDANHGFEVPPGVAVATSNGTNDDIFYEVRTSSLLLSLPVPDFSMPYNVIILTSTVMALAFATIFNLLSREVVERSDEKIVKSTSNTFKDKLRLVFGK